MTDRDMEQLSGDNLPDTGELLNALMAWKKGNFAYRMPYHYTGVAGKVADTFNEIMDIQESMVHEIQQLARVVGKDGNLSRRFALQHKGGSLGPDGRIVKRPDRRSYATDQRHGSGDQRGRAGGIYRKRSNSNWKGDR
ncbi:hypothetical protein OMP38_24910 [Cohnella ginsengisoli]|uniref:HAMP domain-containing protein n=1 Tax=Cohnella ginsengisoli TaxID=425004 RepID=A0A9X4KKH8_9BACL|nr:hypothetical protein [Cohnella ginsengisoli]MDG0793708.1 hypothetical protein [Cohnella ginsengisoli]